MRRGRRGGRLMAAVAGTLLALVAAALVSAAAPKKETTLTITVDPPVMYVGETVSITYQVTPVPDGGYVWDGSQHPVDPVTGTATHAYVVNHAGGYTISAMYSGTDAYLGTSYVDAPFSVIKRPVTASVDAPDAPVGRGDPFDVTFTLDPAPDFGNVALQRQNPDGGWSPIAWETQEAGVAAFHFDWFEPGTYTLRGVYEGSEVYTGATSGTFMLEIFDRPTTTTITTTPNPSLWGEQVTVDVTVTPIPDGGIVWVEYEGLQRHYLTMDWATGTGSATLDDIPDPGERTIHAAYRESQVNRRWAPSDASVTQVISKQPLDTTAPVGTITIDHGNAIAPEGYCVITLDVDEPWAFGAGAEISSDGVAWYPATLWDGDFAWSLNDPSIGGFGAEGVHTLYARWTDRYGNISEIASDSIILDYMAPIGTVHLPDGSYYYVWPDLTVDVTATDLGSGVDLVALSNDGAVWTEMPYQAQVPWTVAPGDGEKTIHVKWRDGLGHWSDPQTRRLFVDSTKPVTTAPSARLIVGGGVESGRVPVKLAWSGKDAGGIAGYELSRSVDGGAWTSPVPVATATTVSLTPGRQYRFKVRAVDLAGNIGPWATGAAVQVESIQQTSARLRWHGAWTTRRLSSAWGGSLRTSSDPGASARVAVTGRAIAWVARTGPNRGVATVYVDGTKVATVDLFSPASADRQLVWSKSWASARSRTITIRVAPASGRQHVDVDGFVVIR